MFNDLMQFLITAIATLLQIVLIPINSLVSSALPDFSSKLAQIPTFFNYIGTALTWIVNAVPEGLKQCFLFMILVEIAKHTIFITANVIIQAWHLLQKIKFW